jgi:peptidoglycan/LPS O-acetylase OafA/YrhL
MREPQTIADPAIHLPAIDGLRGIAVLMVLAVHTSQRVGNVGLEAFQFPLIGEFINAGARGVELFFLLSAFTLFRSLKAKYSEESNPRRNFYIRRAFRILPLWWLAVTLYALWGGRSLGESVPSYLLYFGFIRYLPGLDVFPLGWTIFVEETFYLFLPVIFGFIVSTTRAAVFFAVMLELSVIWRHNASLFEVPATNAFIELFPLSHWYCFALGILLYWAYANEFVNRYLLQNCYVSWIMDVSAVLILYLTVRGDRSSACYGLALFALVALSEHSLVGRLCRSAFLRYFGVCCYSIYLLHFLFLDLSDGLKESIFSLSGLNNGPVEVMFLVWFPTIALLMLALCLVVFYCVEKPCVDLGKRLIRRLEAGKTMAPPVLETSG